MFRILSRHVSDGNRTKEVTLRREIWHKFISSGFVSKDIQHKNKTIMLVYCNKSHKLTTKASFIQQNRRLFATSNCRQMKEDHKTGTLSVWSDLKQLKASPVPALTLGLFGLVPFVAAPSYMICSGIFLANLAFAQTAYGACILSFIGGARWGFTLYEDNPVQPDWVNLGYSVLPSLIAWCGLLLPSTFSNLALIGGLTFAAYADMVMFGYPSWFKGLRFVLSIVAILSLWTSFMCSLILAKPPTDQEEKSGP